MLGWRVALFVVRAALGSRGQADRGLQLGMPCVVVAALCCHPLPQRNAVFKVVVKTGRGNPVGDVLPIRRLPTVVLDGGGCALGCFQRVGPCVVSLQLLKYLCECFRCLLL